MRTTLLRHVLADGSWHVDWLIEVEATARKRLPTFRLEDRPDRPSVDRFAAVLLGDHRRAYLDYEGPVSGDRGRVEQLATGQVVEVSGWPTSIDVTVDLESRRWCWRGEPAGDARWIFERRAVRE
ncbi:MAG: hypothetical protein AAFN41_03895 [Planctomycetota bacterium]